MEWLEPRFNVPGRLELRILVATIGHNRHVKSILGVIDRIVDAQTRFLFGRQRVRQILDVAARGGKAGSGPQYTPPARVMEAEMPCPRAAHREAAQHHPRGIE